MFTQYQHSKIMRFSQILFQLSLLVIIWWVGDFIQKVFHLPVSAGVIGLLLLLLTLLSGIFKLQWIKQGADLILAELVLFFIPCVVGLIKYKHLFLTQGGQLFIAILAGTICVMLVTAYVVHLGFKLEAYMKDRKQTKSQTSNLSQHTGEIK